MPVGSSRWFDLARQTRAFSSEVGTGSREENASKQEWWSPGFDAIKTG
jgi:hypothetical protein